MDYTAPILECAGTVTFDYTVTDFDGDSDTATVTLTVIPVNDPPVAHVIPEPPTVWGLLEDSLVPINLDVAANDTDADGTIVLSSVAIVSCPGGATCSSIGDGTVDFLPAANFSGDLHVLRTRSGTTSGHLPPRERFGVEVTAVNDPPVAANDSATTN